MISFLKNITLLIESVIHYMEQQSETNSAEPEDVNQEGILQDSEYQTNTDRDMWDEYIAWCISQENNTHE